MARTFIFTTIILWILCEEGLMIKDGDDRRVNPNNTLTQIEFTFENGGMQLIHSVFQVRMGHKTRNLYTFGSVIVESREGTLLATSKAFYFDLTPIAFEVDSKEEFVYFLAQDAEGYFVNQFSNEKQSLVISIKNSDLAISNSDLFLNNQSLYFTASYTNEQTSALGMLDFIESPSSFNGTRFRAYRFPLSLVMTGDASFVVTLVPYGEIDHVMIFNVDYRSYDTGESRLIGDRLNFKDWSVGAALFYQYINIVYKLDYFGSYIFYAINCIDGSLIDVFDIPNETENLLNNGKISITQYQNFKYIYNIKCLSNCNYFVFNSTLNKFLGYRYNFRDYVKFFGTLKTNKFLQHHRTIRKLK